MTASRCLLAAFSCAMVLALNIPGNAAATQSQAVRPASTLTRPLSQTAPPRGHRLSAREAKRISAHSEKLQGELTKHGRVRSQAFVNGPRTWQVSYYAGRKEIAQVVVDERKRSPVEVWTGPQVEWQMARGLSGAFGRKVNAPYVWIPLMVAFVVPFFDWRRPCRLLHLDLLVLLAFSL